jgi:hypothetical protein
LLFKRERERERDYIIIEYSITALSIVVPIVLEDKSLDETQRSMLQIFGEAFERI